MFFTGERAIPKLMKPSDITLIEHLARYNWAAQFVKDKKVLDAACGAGYGSRILLDAGHAAGVFGCDICPETLGYAFKEYGINCTQHDLSFTFPDTAFDVVVSFETIEHLEFPETFLDNVRKSCGRFLFSIPILNPSKFHKQIYSTAQAKELIKKYFNKVVFYSQIGDDISLLINQRPTFLVGDASN